MNWVRISRLRAPVAMRMPISRVRSVTETSMMFITPMPPTKSEMAAIDPEEDLEDIRGLGKGFADRGHVDDLRVLALVTFIQKRLDLVLRHVDGVAILHLHGDGADVSRPKQPQVAGRQRHQNGIVLVVAAGCWRPFSTSRR